jgi:hypothetical protein
MVDSNDLLGYLKSSPSLVRQNVETFREELHGLNSGKPTILAFGAAAHRLLAEHMSGGDYSRLIKVSLTVASWNQVADWLRRLERLREPGEPA